MQVESEHLADTSACAGVRADLKLCLLESECCRKVCFRSHLISVEVCDKLF